jgi:hypothetical protein
MPTPAPGSALSSSARAASSSDTRLVCSPVETYSTLASAASGAHHVGLSTVRLPPTPRPYETKQKTTL